MAEGRLGMGEFDERLEAAYKARTYGEPAPPTRDPAPSHRSLPSPSPRPRWRTVAGRPPRGHRWCRVPGWRGRGARTPAWATETSEEAALSAPLPATPTTCRPWSAPPPRPSPG
nr:DUF1707 domain-containing protein [Streptomyces olivaceoviridis]